MLQWAKRNKKALQQIAENAVAPIAAVLLGLVLGVIFVYVYDLYFPEDEGVPFNVESAESDQETAAASTSFSLLRDSASLLGESWRKANVDILALVYSSFEDTVERRMARATWLKFLDSSTSWCRDLCTTGGRQIALARLFAVMVPPDWEPNEEARAENLEFNDIIYVEVDSNKLRAEDSRTLLAVLQYASKHFEFTYLLRVENAKTFVLWEHLLPKLARTFPDYQNASSGFLGGYTRFKSRVYLAHFYQDSTSVYASDYAKTYGLEHARAGGAGDEDQRRPSETASSIWYHPWKQAEGRFPADYDDFWRRLQDYDEIEETDRYWDEDAPNPFFNPADVQPDRSASTVASNSFWEWSSKAGVDAFPFFAMGPASVIGSALIQELLESAVPLRHFPRANVALGVWLMLKKVEKIHAGMSLDGTGCHKVSPRESHKQVVAIVPRSSHDMWTLWQRWLVLGDGCARPDDNLFAGSVICAKDDQQRFDLSARTQFFGRKSLSVPDVVSEDVFLWQTSEWTPCMRGDSTSSGQTEGLQWRCVGCVGADGNQYDSWLCESASRPTQIRTCGHQVEEISATPATSKYWVLMPGAKGIPWQRPCTGRPQQEKSVAAQALSIVKALLDQVGLPFFMQMDLAAAWEVWCIFSRGLSEERHLRLIALHRHFGTQHIDLLREAIRLANGNESLEGSITLTVHGQSSTCIGCELEFVCPHKVCGGSGEGGTPVFLHIAEETLHSAIWLKSYSPGIVCSMPYPRAFQYVVTEVGPMAVAVLTDDGAVQNCHEDTTLQPLAGVLLAEEGIDWLLEVHRRMSATEDSSGYLATAPPPAPVGAEEDFGWAFEKYTLLDEEPWDIGDDYDMYGDQDQDDMGYDQDDGVEAQGDDPDEWLQQFN